MTPWQRTAEQVLRYYVSRPELVAALLERMGAQRINRDHRSIRCTCPLHHGDNDQAFAVWMDKGYIAWRCHTRCATKGNLVTLVMRKYHVGFEQAVAALARFAGLAISGPQLRIDPQQLREESIETLRRRLGIREDRAAVFTETWLADARAGWGLPLPGVVEAWHFLTGSAGSTTRWGEHCRQFTPEMLAMFEVGFVPAGRWLLPDPQDHSRRVGWFEDRIAIPWRDWDGRCIGFSGRRFDGQKYLKYKTFPGTKKSLALYGLHHERCRRAIAEEGHVVIVEGFTDVWRGWSLGFFNVVAAGGTELSPAQITLLRRFHLRNVVLYFDGDEAGVTSARRMADQLRNVARIRCGFPPEGKDPGDLLDAGQYGRGIVDSKVFI